MQSNISAITNTDLSVRDTTEVHREQPERRARTEPGNKEMRSARSAQLKGVPEAAYRRKQEV